MADVASPGLKIYIYYIMPNLVGGAGLALDWGKQDA